MAAPIQKTYADGGESVGHTPMAATDGPPGRCTADTLDDGTLRLYDPENDDAWIRSDTTRDLAWQT